MTWTLQKKIYRPTGERYSYDLATPTITGFFGDNRVLSNFYPRELVLYNIPFKTAEHAYVWHKSNDLAFRRMVLAARSPVEAKRIGRKVQLRADWEQVKLQTMRIVLDAKFRDPQLRDFLLNTGFRYLEELNTWDDRYWGVCGGLGKNHLGRQLMVVRESYR
jgi:hypothetical protein